MRTLLILGLLLWLPLFAATPEEINALIDDIVHADPQTRYEKLNAFKLKMRELNAEQRRNALRSLQTQMYPELDPAQAAGTMHAGSGTQTSGQNGAVQRQQLRLKQPAQAGGAGGPNPKAK